MSEEMINLESYDTLSIRMPNPTQHKMKYLPQPPFFMDPKKALPFWLVRSLQDKMPMVSIPEKIKVPYTRGLVGETLVQSIDPNEFAPVDPTEGGIEYAPLHDRNLKKYFQKSFPRRMVEMTGELVEGRTVCRLKEYNDYRHFIHKMQLNHVVQEQREEEQIKHQQKEVEQFLTQAKKEGKEKWNKKYKEYLKLKNQEVVQRGANAKMKRCLERLAKADKAADRVKEAMASVQEIRKAKGISYKKRMENYFKAIKDDQRRRGIYARKRWVVEAVINEHRRSLNLAENKLKRELVMETNWGRRMAGQKLKLKKDKLVQEQYNACLQLMRQRREQYYNRKGVEIDELLSLPGMNSLEELEVFNTQFDQFSPEFIKALGGAKFFMNRSGKSPTLDKSLRKYITHHESATERMKKANVARPIKHALELMIRRAVGYYAMVVTYKTIMNSTQLALNLADKIQENPKLRELLVEEYKQFGPRSDIPFQTAKNFDEKGLTHCICDYKLIDKDTLGWPCPLCRKDQESPYQSGESSSDDSSVEVEQDEVYVVGEGTTTLGFLVPPKITEGVPEMIVQENKVDVDTMVIEQREKKYVPMITNMMGSSKPDQEPDYSAMMPSKTIERRGSKTSKKSMKSAKSKKSSVGSRKAKKGSEASRKHKPHEKKIAPSKEKNKKPSGEKAAKHAAKDDAANKPGADEGGTKEPKSDAEGDKAKTTEELPPPPPSTESEREKPPTKVRARDSRKDSRKKPKKSILKPQPEKKIAKESKTRLNNKKGVSFAEQAEYQKSAQNRYPAKETMSLLTQPQNQTKEKVIRARSAATSEIGADLTEQRSKCSIVSLLSITSDDRLHFVKGQCVYTKRGSKFGKLLDDKASHGVKKGFIRGVCKCTTEHEALSGSGNTSNITEKLNEEVVKRHLASKNIRWRGAKADRSTTSSEAGGAKLKESPKDIATILDKLSPKKQTKIKYYVGAEDLTIKCQCLKCTKEAGELAARNTIENALGERVDVGVCNCKKKKKMIKIADKKADRLAHMTKVIGGQDTIWPRETSMAPEKKSVSSRKLSAKSIIERQKSIISRLFKKKSLLDTVMPAAAKREPEVQKYYMDDLGNAYVLNRYGVKTVLSSDNKTFKLDERGRKYLIDENAKKYFVDVTGRMYLEDENGDVYSIFHEDEREYVDPEPKKLLLHNLVRESVVDLLHEAPQEEYFDNEDELVEMVYEYFEGRSSEEKSEDAESRMVETKSNESAEEQEFTAPSGKMPARTQSDENQIGPRMPIKRPLNSLINEVPFNREISKLFIQRKKFHDCAAIVFRRCLLYSLASYTKIMEKGFDALDQMGDRKKVTGLDGLVKGLTKITAHYPLKLVKSKRLAPYVDALVHGFLGSEGYQIFRGRKPSVHIPYTPDETESVMSTESAKEKKKGHMTIDQVDNLNEMTRICFCGKPNAHLFVDKHANMTTSELMKSAACIKKS